MTIQRKALILVGSPKVNSTSDILGTYLFRKLQEKGTETEKVRIYPLMKSDEGGKQLLSSIDRADILILTTPLYVDSLPSPVIKLFEMLWEYRRSQEHPKKHQFFAISNNGFPEASHNDTAFAICRCFVRQTGMEWGGSLGVGGGRGISFISELFGWKPLEKIGFISKKERKALDSIAEFLSSDGTIPQKAMELRTNRPIPKWMYILIGIIFDWRRQARKNNAWDRIYDHPYQR